MQEHIFKLEYFEAAASSPRSTQRISCSFSQGLDAAVLRRAERAAGPTAADRAADAAAATVAWPLGSEGPGV